MPTTLATVNPNSSQILGKIPAIFRDDNASYYVPATLADDATEKIIDDTTSTIPEDSILLVTINDLGAFGNHIGIFMYSAGAIYMVSDPSTKFDDADTDAKVCLYISSNDLYIKNRTGASVASGKIRIYRLV